ncbi:MAG: phosphoribosyltransferase family protein [Saprospiraceae bacterium]
MKILNERQIAQKVKRLAIEILEHNFGEPEIILAGINNNGMVFSELLLQELTNMSNIPITVTRIRLNPANPLSADIILEMPPEAVKDKVLIIVDDVANTGRTIFYAIKPILEVLPKKVEVAVLVDRSHKSFPIRVDYYGLSLATTLKNNIDVKIQATNERAVFLN